MTSKLRKRHEIDLNDTWDLSQIFSDHHAWQQTFKNVQKDLKHLNQWQDKLHDPDTLKTCLDSVSAVERKLAQLHIYAFHTHATDMSDVQGQTMLAQVKQLSSEFSQMTAYIEPEMSSLSDETLEEYKNDERFDIYTMMIRKLVRNKKHILSKKEEKLLSRASVLWGDVSDIYTRLKDVDMQFPDAIDENDVAHTVTHGNLKVLLESSDRILRKNAYESVYGQLQKYNQTFAQSLYGQVKQHHYFADIRNYNDTLDAALYGNAIDRQVYQTLIDVFQKNLHVFHRYLSLKKRWLNLDKMYLYDLYVPIISATVSDFDYHQAVQMCLQASMPLGKDYVSVLEAGLTHKRWVDRYENKAKMTGAFHYSVHDTMPYILLNFQGKINDVYTMIHEAGHAMHSYLAKQNQPHTKSQYTIFIAEIASTLNERLLTQSLLEKAEGKERASILAEEIDGLAATFFRQAMFASFERSLHQLVEKGEPLTAETINNTWFDLNKKYYGDYVELDALSQTSWARVPHFYYNYYVYQYATSVVCSCNFAKGILSGNDVICGRYIHLLKSGGKDFPLELLYQAGIDMKDSRIYDDFLGNFSALLDDLEHTMSNI